MAVFATFLDDETAEARERIAEHYPGTQHLELTDQLFLISSDSIADSVARNIGLKGDDQIKGLTGVVFKLNAAYAGFTYRSIWDWLTEAEKSAR